MKAAAPECTLLSWVAAVVVLWSLLIYQLRIQWTLYEQYRFGWTVPFLCSWLLVRRWSSVEEAAPPGRFVSGALRFTRLDNAARAKKPVVVCLATLAALLYAPTRWLHEANPVWRFTSLLWAVEVILLTLCIVQWLGGDEGLRRSWLPISFFLVAVPWPSGLEHGVVTWLTRFNAAAVVEVLRLLGYPALLQGNLIETAAGTIGIDEACSGIRSVQATLMLSVFLGEFYRLNLTQRCWCVGAGCLLCLIGNLARTILLAVITAGTGLSGLYRWHDPAGISVVLTSLLALWALARVFASRAAATQLVLGVAPFGALRQVRLPFSIPGQWLTRSRVPAWTLVLWLGLVESSTELWYRAREKLPEVPQWTISRHPALGDFEVVQTRPEILAEFGADESFEGRWQDPGGIAGQVYCFRWRPARSLRRRAQVQVAKTHGPMICLPAVGLTLTSDCGRCEFSVGDTKVAFRQYSFRGGQSSVEVFYGLDDGSGSAEPLGLGRSNTRERMSAALAGNRNSQLVLIEIALFGCSGPEAARVRLGEILAELMDVPKSREE